MALKTAPIYSEPIYLSDISPDVAGLEEGCEREDRAWVKLRQATEKDNMEISALTSSSRTVWTDDGIEQESSINQREIRAMEVYHTLVDVGNIFKDDEGKVPLFTFSNGRVDGGFQKFKEDYGELPSAATWAILRAVYKVNPSWDWLADPRHKCPECGKTFVPSSRTRVIEGEAV